MITLLVVLGGAVGAPVRYLTDRWVASRLGGDFPWGTFVVNVAGSLVLGAVVGAAASPAVTALVGTGFCGALTTYSTFGHETVRLLGARSGLLAALNAVGSVAAGLGAAGLGLAGGGTLAGWV